MAVRGQQQRLDWLVSQPPLQVVRTEPCVLADPTEHLRSEFDGVMEGENVVRPSLAREYSMRPSLTKQHPTDPKQSGVHSTCLRGLPLRHQAAKETESTLL